MSQQLVFDLNVDNQAAISSINTFFDAFEAGVKSASNSLDKQFGDKNKVIGIKLEGGKAIATEMDNVNSLGNKLKGTVKALNGEYGKTPGEVRNSIGLLRSLLSTTQKYETGTKKVTNEWKQLVTRLRDAKNIAKDMQISDGMEKSITGANIAAGLALDAIRALGRGVMDFIKQGIEMEVLMIQLEGFTGGVEQAEAAFTKFVEIAKATPFDVKQVANAARTMMGFGISSEEAGHRVKQLAIVAASTGGDLNQMARNLGQIQANQKAYTRDLMQFANQGIPIYQMLGEVMGKTTEQVRGMAEEGKIGFAEVAAALDLMTQKGSAYEQIANRMSTTFQSRLEEIASAVTTTSAHFIAAIQAMDQALGGPLEKSMEQVANLISGIGNAFKFIAKNANELRPVIMALTTVLLGAVGIAMVQNIGAIAAAFIALKVQIMGAFVATKLYAAAKAVVVALSGNFAALALAAGVAAAAGIAFGASQKESAEETKNLTEQMDTQKGKALEAVDAEKSLAFQTKDVTGAIKEKIEAHKEEFQEAQKGYDLAKTEMERALQFLTEEAEKRKEKHEEKKEQIKEAIQVEKDGMDQALQKAKDVHDVKMQGLKDELSQIRENYDEQIGLLDEESVYAKELRAIRKEEIQAKLQAGGLSRKETLELKEQLLQLGRQEERKKLIAEKTAAVKEAQDKINEATDEHERTLDKIKNQYGDRVRVLEEAYKAEEQAIAEIDRNLKTQSDKVAQFKKLELTAIYENRDAALASLDAQIVRAGQLQTAMKAAYSQAIAAQNAAARARATANSGGRGTSGIRAAGGPVSGGSTYTVNELGKEAFLSASGALSMINAPSYGAWKAPSSGTVIPAHLTRQLDIPSGGVKLNGSAGMNGSSAGGNGMQAVARAMSAIRTSNVSNNVTIQAVNPRQQATETMVQLTKLKRLRYS